MPETERNARKRMRKMPAITKRLKTVIEWVAYCSFSNWPPY